MKSREAVCVGRHVVRGFTLLELLAAMTIIAVILAIAVPAVMHARETSRRTRCASNLANLGRALHAHEAALQKFPAAQRPETGHPGATENRHYAPHVYLLPFLEQATLYNEVESISVPPGFAFEEGTLGVAGPHRELATTPVSVFLCPSDSGDAGVNYRVCLGTGAWEVYALPDTPDAGKGAFTSLKQYSAGEFTDGLSHTVAMSEKSKSDDDSTWFQRDADFWFTGLYDITGTIPPPDEMVTVCASLSGNPLEYEPEVGVSWMFSSYAQTWYNHATTPNSDVPDCSVVSWSHPHTPANAGVYTARSRHSGGVNVLYMDGSVRFTGDSVDLGVWRAVATRGSGEIVASTSF